MRYINDYYSLIIEGEIITSAKIEKTYKYLNSVIAKNGVGTVWIYDEELAQHAIDFVEDYCKHSKGKMGGKPFILELWQKAAVAAIFGVVHKVTKERKHKEVMLLVARKNGKSTLAAAIGLYMLFMDGELGPEVVSAATKKDQAKIIWLEAKRMIAKSPMLAKQSKRLVSEINTSYNDGVFKPLSSDSNTMDGLNPSCALLDELHAVNKELYDVIVDGMISRERPLIMITTTAGTVREDIYDIKYQEGCQTIEAYEKGEEHDERVLFLFYELDDRKEYDKPEMWVKANPGLGTIKSIEELSRKVKKAVKNPRLIGNLLTKDFNMPETSSAYKWLTYEQLNNEAMFDITQLKPKYGIGGFDLSATTDLTCATLIFKIPDDEHIFVLQRYWIPEDSLAKRGKEERRMYEIWEKNGYIHFIQGNKIDYSYITKWFTEVSQEYGILIPYFGYDAWSSTYLVEDIKNHFGNALFPVIQGKKTLSGPMKGLAADLESKKIIYNNNPMLKWCIDNTVVDVDKNDNIQPSKGRQGAKRIDGLASLLDAYVIYEQKKLEYEDMIR